MTRRLRLKPGVSVEQLQSALSPLVAEARNVFSAPSHGMQEAYVRWVDSVERQLVALTRDPLLVQVLQSERYWRIRDIHAKTPMAYDFVTRELELHLEWLVASLGELNARADRLRSAPGQPVVLDTNVLLEFLPPWEVP